MITLITDEPWLEGLNRFETVSLTRVLQRMERVNEQVEVIETIYDDMALVVLPNPRLLPSFGLLFRQIQELYKLAHEDARTTFALRRLAYDRRKYLMQYRDLLGNFNLDLRSAASSLREAYMGLDESAELLRLVHDSSWEDEPGIELSLSRLEEIIPRYARFFTIPRPCGFFDSSKC